MHSRYKQVSQEDKQNDNEENAKKEKAELSERLSVKIHVSNIILWQFVINNFVNLLGDLLGATRFVYCLLH